LNRYDVSIFDMYKGLIWSYCLLRKYVCYKSSEDRTTYDGMYIATRILGLNIVWCWVRYGAGWTVLLTSSMLVSLNAN